MKRVREILRMHECKISNRTISIALKVSRPVVSEYLEDFRQAGLNFAAVEKMGDEELLSRIKKEATVPGKRTELADRFADYAKELKRIGVTLRLLWETYRSENPAGYGYSQFCYHFHNWRKNSEVSMHIEHRVGDKTFIDFAGKKFKYLHPITGEEQEADIFVAILGASQLTYVEATNGQKKEDWIRATENAFRYFGGVTRAVVPDNAKAVVTKACRYEPDINPEYADFACHYGTTILPARPRKPKDKPLAENVVDLTYERIYAPLRDEHLTSTDDLNRAIREKLEDHNNRPMQKLKISRRAMFEDIERSALLPLPVDLYEFKKFQGPLTVQINYHIYLSEDCHYYSVPYRCRSKGQEISVIYTEKTVELYADNLRIAAHARNRTPHAYSTVPEHMPSQHRHIAERHPKRYLIRAERLGLHVRKLVRNILRSRAHPEQAFKSCEGVLRLADRFDLPRLNNACRRALEHGAHSYKAVKNILEKGLDRIVDEQPELSILPSHANIRGEGYYDVGGIDE